MALTDVAIRRLKAKSKPYSTADGGGLFIEVMPAGSRSWGLRYRLDGRQETARLGAYPDFSLADARLWRDDCKAMVARGLSPAAIKRDGPNGNESAMAYLRRWFPVAAARAEAAVEVVTMEVIAWRWFQDVAVQRTKNPSVIERALRKDVIPAIGSKAITGVTVADILALTDRIKARGADQMALVTRNIVKRIFAFAIARGHVQFNPAAAVDPKYIATAKARDRALSQDEIGRLLRGVYQSNMNRQHKLALHLLLLTMVRKSELIEAAWSELDLDSGGWLIPGERMKKARPHVVPLPKQAVAIFEELKILACGSQWVFPSHRSIDKPISKSTLNAAVKAVSIDVQQFVIHDFRRTASTHLHEAGFSSDWIEKALAHETKGIRGVYNKARYQDQRRDMLQWWADFVDAQLDDGRKVIIGRFGRHRAA